MKKLILFTVAILTANLLFAQIINIPDDYPTIQEGISAANAGDTVLVQPGTYIENITIDKNIKVGSLCLTTNDTSYISSTIINGDDNGSVVVFNNNNYSSTLLCGFTLTNGKAEKGGGIYCHSSSPTLKHLKIISNEAYKGYGGGIYFKYSYFTMENIVIKNNSVFNYENLLIGKGGGIYICWPNLSSIKTCTISENTAGERGGGIYVDGGGLDWLFLEDVLLTNNIAINGGGIYCAGCVDLSHVTIKKNEAQNGGGISDSYGWLNFNLDKLSNIYSNRAVYGNDIWTINDELHIQVDTFTVINPTAFHAYNPDHTEEITFSIQHGLLNQVDNDLYVSPNGDNNNNGLSPEEPLKNIYHAHSKILPGNSIYIQPGVYSPSNNNEFFPVNIVFDLNLIGYSKTTCILDPENTVNVIQVNCNSSEISSLTIQGGGYRGISCRDNYELVLEDLIIRNNTGGGLYFRHSNSDINNVIIYNNQTEMGGGIYLNYNSTLELANVSIFNNSATYGGGIYSEANNPLRLDFDESDRCNIYNNSANYGNDLYTIGPINIIVDTFSVLYPTKYYAAPTTSLYTFDILNGFNEQIDADIYVSPDGDNSNSGISEEDPFKTIRFACAKMRADSLHKNNIFLLEGTYSPSANGEMFPINPLDYVDMIGVAADEVIINAEGTAEVFNINSNLSNTISGLTITGGSRSGIRCDNANSILIDLSLHENQADNYGGGIYSNNSYLILQNISLSYNSADWEGGGIFFKESTASLTNLLIANNSAYEGGGISFNNSFATLTNTTFKGNYGQHGSGIFCTDNTDLNIRNSIFRDFLFQQEIYFDDNIMPITEPDTLTISYSNLNDTAIITNNNGKVYWLDGNIDENPRYVYYEPHPCQLNDDSPCIDAGTPDTTGLNLPEYDLAGEDRIFNNRVDMGAYEWNMFVGIEETVLSDGQKTELSIYPNPVSENCYLEFDLPFVEQVTIQVYNSVGKLIDKTDNSVLQSGSNQVKVNMANLPEGIYFVKVQVGNDIVTKKIIKVH